MKSEDILHREQFVNQTVKIIEKLSQNSASTSFAINGTWGSGKSFVLDLLEDKLCNLVTAEKEYCIIRYNCWENGCKQSFRVHLIVCPHYGSRRAKNCMDMGGKSAE